MRTSRRIPARVSKILVIGAAAFLVLGAAILGWRVANVSRALIERGIAAATGASISIESGGFTLAEGLTLRTKNFRAAWPDGSTMIEAQSLTLSVELVPLLRRRLVVRQVTMGRGRVVLGEDAVDSIRKRPARLPLVDLTGAGLRLKDVTLRYGDPLSSHGGEPGLRFRDLTLQASPREDPGVSVSFAFSAENAPARGLLPPWMPRVGATGRLLLRGNEIVFDETVLSLRDMRVAGAGRWRLTEEGLALSESRWSTQDISFSLSGQASSTGNGLAYVFHLSAPDVSISALRTASPASLWSGVSPLATAEGAVGVELIMGQEKTAGTLALHGVTLRLDDRLPPVTLTGALEIESESLALGKIQGRIGESLFEIEGRVEDALSPRWSVEAGFGSTLLFPAALDLVPPETARRIEMVGTVPLTGRILATAGSGSFEVSAALGGLERLDLLQLRNKAASAGWLKTRTFWEAGKDVSSEIELTLSQGEVFALPAEDVHVHALLKGGVLEVQSVSFSLDQGRAEGHAHIESSTASAELRVREAEANTFVSRLLGAPDRLYGKLSMDAHLRSTGTNTGELLRGSTGNIEVVVEKGRLENVDLPAQLLQMATLAHEGVLDFNLTRAIKALSPEPVDHFELLSGRFDIDKGVARTENLVFVAHNLGLQGKGTVNLASGAIDFVVEGQVPKESRDHAGPIDRALGLIRIGKALDLLRKLPGLDVILGEVEKEHVFRLRLTGNLEGEKTVTEFAWVR